MIVISVTSQLPVKISVWICPEDAMVPVIPVTGMLRPTDYNVRNLGFTRR